MRFKRYIQEFAFNPETHIKGAKAGYDKSIAKALVILNKKGYKTYASHSGLQSDHKIETSPSGYISFLKADLTQDQIDKIKVVGKKLMDKVETYPPNMIVVRLWAKKTSDPYSEDLPFNYIKNKWIQFANNL